MSFKVVTILYECEGKTETPIAEVQTLETEDYDEAAEEFESITGERPDEDGDENSGDDTESDPDED